jgi:FKBP-type peptidyl-prolyl cis-trans isomerase FkpA
MTKRLLIPVFLILALVAGCGGEGSGQEPAASEPAAEPVEAPASVESFEIVPGLGARILRPGQGDAAEAGDSVEVHYTGWLYDEAAPEKRGEKFDSSVDRGATFRFPLGAGRVIKGWDQGVAGMQIGEIRELTIAPDLAYGERGYPPVIPPSSTLVFEVELFSAESLGGPAGQQ